MTLQVLTANRLVDGIAVWYHPSGEWAEGLQGAEVVETAEAVARLEAIGKKAYADNLVLDVNLIDVEWDNNGRILPLRMRERIRAAGPSIDYVI